MAKGNRGRPRKEGERYPCGKLKSTFRVAKDGDNGVSPAQWARIRTDAVKLTGDQRLCSELGSLSFHGELTARQTAAGFWVAQIYAAFESLHGRRRYARSPSYEIGIRGTPHGNEENLDAENDFLDLQEHIPLSMRSMLEQLCVENIAVSSLYLDEIRWLLNKLADVKKHWEARAKKKDKKRNLNVERVQTVVQAPIVVSRKQPHFDRPFSAMTIGELFPDLDHDEISQVIAYRHALKDRADYRKEQSVRGSGRRNISEKRAA